MTLRFIESFDHYNAVADLQLGKWTSTTGGTVSATNGRLGTKILQFSSSSAMKVLDAQSTWVVGCAVYLDNAPSVSSFLRFYDEATLHVDVRVDGNLNVLVTRNGTLLATSATALRTATWHYIEVRVKIDDSAGEIEMQIDGVPETLTFVSGSWNTQDTRNAGNASADRVYFNSLTNTIWRLDDVYVCDGVDATGTQGAPYNDFLGDCRVECVMPNGNGNSSQLDGSDGNQTDNYLLVDETSGTFSADYVESSDVGDKDTYTYGNLTPTAGTVYAVQVLPLAAKTDAGTRKVASIARLSGTEVDSADQTLTTSYNWYPDLRTTKPGGGSWSISDVNSAEFGVKVTA